MRIQYKNIKAVTFDGDGTLWNFEIVMLAALEKVLEAVRRLTDETVTESLSVCDLVKIRNDLGARQRGGALDHETLRRDSFRILLERVGLSSPQLVDQLTAIYFEHRFGAIELYDDALPVLTELRRNFGVGLISNGNNDPERFGHASYFDSTTFAHNCGFSKPDPRIFRVALRDLGIEPHQTVHIGDSLLTDVAGARASGIPAIWLNRSGTRNDTGIHPDATIMNLHELIEIMKE